MLTKSDFLLYLESPMHLWASAHNQLESKPPSLLEQHLSLQGQQVESHGHTYLEEVLLPHYPNAQLIWQPSYETSKFKIRADALIFDADAKAYDLYEIKSSTSVNKRHEYDLTFQVLVLERFLNLRYVYLLHIDKTYIQNYQSSRTSLGCDPNGCASKKFCLYQTPQLPLSIPLSSPVV